MADEAAAEEVGGLRLKKSVENDRDEERVVNRLRASTEEARLARLKVEALLAEEGADDDALLEAEAVKRAAMIDEPSSPGSARARLEELLGSSDEDEEFQVVSQESYKGYRRPQPSEMEKVKLEMAQAANAAQTAAKAVAAASLAGATRAVQSLNSRLLLSTPTAMTRGGASQSQQRSWKSASPTRSLPDDFSDDGLDMSPVRQSLQRPEKSGGKMPPLLEVTTAPDHNDISLDHASRATPSQEAHITTSLADTTSSGQDQQQEEEAKKLKTSLAENTTSSSQQQQQEEEAKKLTTSPADTTSSGQQQEEEDRLRQDGIPSSRQEPEGEETPLIGMDEVVNEKEDEEDYEDEIEEEDEVVVAQKEKIKSKKSKRKKYLLPTKSLKAVVKAPKQQVVVAAPASIPKEEQPAVVIVQPEPQTEDSADDVETMRRKLALLQKHAGINDEDLEWKLAETSTNDPYGLAVRERERCEERYDRLMWNQSKLEAMIRIGDDRRVNDALDAIYAAAEHATKQRHNTKTDDAEEKKEEKKTPAPEDEKKEVGGARAALGAALAGRGGGGLMAAIAARGRGRGRGIGMKASALGALTAGGRRQSSKQPKSVEKATEALAQVQERSRNEVNKLPVQLDEFRFLENIMQDVLDRATEERHPPDPSVSNLQGDEGSDDPEAPDPSAREARRLRLRNQMLDTRDAQISAASAAAKASIAMALSTFRHELKANGRELLDAEDELERWRKREQEAPNRAESLKREEDEWAQREAAENGIALAMIRSYVPSGVASESYESLRLRAAKNVAAAASKAAAAKKKEASDENQQVTDETKKSDAEPIIVVDEKKEAKRAFQFAAAWGGALTHELAQRIKNSRPLHWVQMHQDDIVTSNFLAGAGADSFRNVGDYDIIELRAIYAVCPDRFELDATGTKAAWRRNLVERLRQLTSRDRGESVSAGWDALKNQRKLTKLPPLEPKLKRHPAYYYPSSNELEARTKKHTEARTRLDERRKKVDDLETKLAEAKAERDAAFADARSEYLQQRYGKPMLKQLARDADEAYKAILTELGNDVVGAKADLKRANSAVANASPTESEHASLRKLLEKYKLDKADPEADANDCRRLAIKALDKLGYENSPNDLWPIERAEFSDDRGRLIRGPFDPWPEIKRMQQSVLKKLSDAEEAELRKREIQQATSSAATAAGGGSAGSTLAARRKALEKRATSSSSVDTNRSSRRDASESKSSITQKQLQPVAPRSKRLSQILQQQELNPDQPPVPPPLPQTQEACQPDTNQEAAPRPPLLEVPPSTFTTSTTMLVDTDAATSEDQLPPSAPASSLPGAAAAAPVTETTETKEAG